MKRILIAVLMTLLPAAAHAAGGTIAGKVDVTPAKYLAETVVYLEEVPGAPPKAKTSMDQTGMVFTPHVLAITAGDTVDFLNHDKVDHNVFSPDNEGYNLGTFKSGETRSQTFAKPGVYSQLCSIHPEMLAYIWVGQNPYHAVVDAKGAYEIKDVPAGSWKLAVWNSKLKAPSQAVTVTDGKTATANFSLKR